MPSASRVLIACLCAVICFRGEAGTAKAEDYTSRVHQQVGRVTQEDQHGAFRPNWQSLGKYQIPDWYRDAKFGIFLHWGIYSVPAFGTEWYSRNMYVEGNPAFQHQVATYGSQSSFGYKDFIPMFHGERFDANAWVDLFARAGAKYIVPVGEHCDGFAMYASQLTDWNAAKMGPKRDVVGELEKATRSRGLHFGVSSHRAEHWWWYDAGKRFDSDVRNPKYLGIYGPAEPEHLPGETDTKEPDPNHLELWLPPDRAFLEDWLARSTEIVDRYHPDFMYFDWWIGQPAFQPYLKQFAAYYYDRAEERHQPVVMTYKEYAMPENTAVLDIERGKLDALRLLPWQTDTSISEKSWGYIENDNYRDSRSLVAELVDVVSKNGNLLLNVGPKADGTIPVQAQKTLLEMGKWLSANGEAIYGTRPWLMYGEGPTKVAKAGVMGTDAQTYTAQDIRFTTHGKTLYAIALGWPPDRKLLIHSLLPGTPYTSGQVCSVDLLGSSETVRWRQQQDGLAIELPAVKPNDLAYTLRIESANGVKACAKQTETAFHEQRRTTAND